MGEIEEVIGVVGHPLQQMEGESLTRALFRFNPDSARSLMP